MCSIIGSFSVERLITNCKLNEYRGQYSHSIAWYDTINNEFRRIIRGMGPLKYEDITDLKDNSIYYIVHMQAPTFEPQDAPMIHPAELGDTKLYHNGILKNDIIEKLQLKYNVYDSWDTVLLLHLVNDVDGNLSAVDGSFSCLYYDGKNLNLFRNEIAPMFINGENFDISSTKFPGGHSLPANRMFKFDPLDQRLTEQKAFATFNTPYKLKARSS